MTNDDKKKLLNLLADYMEGTPLPYDDFKKIEEVFYLIRIEEDDEE